MAIEVKTLGNSQSLSPFAQSRMSGKARREYAHRRKSDHALLARIEHHLVSMSKPTDPFVLTSDHIPVCFPFPPGPSPGGHGSVRFPFLVRFEAQHSTTWRKGPCSPAAGTLHKRDTALLKTLEGNGNDSGKRAVDRCDRLRFLLFPGWCLCHLFSGE